MHNCSPPPKGNALYSSKSLQVQYVLLLLWHIQTLVLFFPHFLQNKSAPTQSGLWVYSYRFVQTRDSQLDRGLDFDKTSGLFHCRSER